MNESKQHMYIYIFAKKEREEEREENNKHTEINISIRVKYSLLHLWKEIFIAFMKRNNECVCVLNIKLHYTILLNIIKEKEKEKESK